LSGESKEPFPRAGGIAEPYLSRVADRPLITHGLQSGDMRVEARRSSPSKFATAQLACQHFVEGCTLLWRDQSDYIFHDAGARGCAAC